MRSIKPLQIWVYKEYYLRFSSLEYNLEDISNRLVHLTNNAIQKHVVTDRSREGKENKKREGIEE